MVAQKNSVIVDDCRTPHLPLLARLLKTVSVFTSDQCGDGYLRPTYQKSVNERAVELPTMPAPESRESLGEAPQEWAIFLFCAGNLTKKTAPSKTKQLFKSPNRRSDRLFDIRIYSCFVHFLPGCSSYFVPTPASPVSWALLLPR